MKIGDLVWYFPTLGGPGFAAEVASEPWVLCGREVVRLRGLGPEYRRHTGRNRTTIPSAATTNVRPRSHLLTEAVIYPPGSFR